MKLTILSHAEIVRAVVDDDDHGEITATYYRRRAQSGPAAWTYLRKTTVAGPLHLALNVVHAVVNTSEKAVR